MRKWHALTIFTILLTLTTLQVQSHGDESDEEGESTEEAMMINTEDLETAKAQYLEKIKPIFKKKCYDCHGKAENFPWYYSLPIVKQFMNHHIEEAQEHMDMTEDFPFKGSKGIKHDLEELEEVIEEGEMPLFSYRIMHKDSAITEEEKTIIFEWIKNTEKSLQKTHEE